MKQQLLTKELEQQFAKTGSQDGSGDPMVIAIFFNAYGRGYWFATEYDPEERVFFGYVSLYNDPGMDELGYFSLDELESLEFMPQVQLIERDASFKPCKLSEAAKRKGVMTFRSREEVDSDV